MKREYRRKVQQLRDAIKQKDETIASLQEKAVNRNKSTQQLPRATNDEKPKATSFKESHDP